MTSSKATPTTTVGRTNGTTRIARIQVRPGIATRWRRYAAGSPRPQASSVATVDVQSVNQIARWISGRVRTSRTPPMSSRPSWTNPLLIIPLTGTTKKTARTASGTAAVAVRVPHRRVAVIGGRPLIGVICVICVTG